MKPFLEGLETVVTKEPTLVEIEKIINSGSAPIKTRDAKGKVNGFLVPMWSRLLDDWEPDQVYMTAVHPKGVKGPHLHMKRVGRFRCMFGNVAIVTREGSAYNERRTGQDYDYRLIEVSPGTPAAIYNLGSTTALVVNMPSPAWCADDPDEWPVENWRYVP